MKKNASINSVFGGLGDYFSFKRVRGIVEGMIDREYQSGLYCESPEIIVDLSFSMRGGRLVCDIWDSYTNKTNYVSVGNTAEYVRALNRKFGLSRCCVLMAHDSPYGRLASTGLVLVPESDAGGAGETGRDKRLSQYFGKQLNINAESSDTEVGYFYFDKADNFERYIVSAIPGENKRKLMGDARVFGGLMDGPIIATRVVDRVLPLSNYILNREPEGERAEMYLCIEQKGQDLLIWNLYRVGGEGGGKYAPVAVEKKKVPQVETYDQLVMYLILMEHELLRAKNYGAPGKVVILTNGEKMMDMDLFKPEDLKNVCLEVIGGSDDCVTILDTDNAAIDGVLEIEKEIAARREEIFNAAAGRGR